LRSTTDSHYYAIRDEMELLPFLYDAFVHRGRNSVKSMLRRGQVYVNERSITQFNHLLKRGDHVEIVNNQVAKRKSALIGLNILYEDRDIIVVHKEAGLLS